MPPSWLPVLLALTGCTTSLRPALDPRQLVCRQVAPDPAHAVAWIAPEVPRDRLKLNEWCSVVGPVLYVPSPAAHFGAEARPLDRLAIISWNTHVGGGDVGDLIARVRAGDFTGGETFDHVVLLLQEVFRSGGGVPERPSLLTAIPGRIALAGHETHARDVRAFAQASGLALLYAPSMRNGPGAEDPEDRGNAILSTLPLSDPAVIELPFESQRRAVTVASIRGHNSGGGQWRLRLANVHLDTALAITRGGPVRARLRQAEALIDALSASSVPTIVAGDFNAWFGEREPAIEALRRAYPDAPRAAGPTWTGPLGVRGTFDYVFARGEMVTAVQRLPHRFGSDHFPLLAVVHSVMRVGTTGDRKTAKNSGGGLRVMQAFRPAITAAGGSPEGLHYR